MEISRDSREEEEWVIVAHLGEQVDPIAFILFVFLGKTEQHDI